MDFLRTLINILNKPFPEEESNFGSPKTISLVSLFVVFVLYVFQPFGISTIESNKFFICVGFGVMTLLATLIYEFTVNQILNLKGNGEKWTFGKWIVNNLGIMLAISLANFLFARLLIFGYIEWSLFPHMMYGTFMIGIVPLIVIGGFSLMQQEKKYQNIAKEINHQGPNPVRVITNHEQSIFDIPLNQIRYVEALQNYVNIGYLDTEGLFSKQTERATLKYMLQATKDSPIVKCHRSFLVNRDAILSTSGNAQGLLLTLADCDKVVPVSRTYVAVFRPSKV